VRTRSSWSAQAMAMRFVTNPAGVSPLETIPLRGSNRRAGRRLETLSSALPTVAVPKDRVSLRLCELRCPGPGAALRLLPLKFGQCLMDLVVGRSRGCASRRLSRASGTREMLCRSDRFACCLGASANCLTEGLPSSLSSRPLVSHRVELKRSSLVPFTRAGRGAQHNEGLVGLLVSHDVPRLVRKVLPTAGDALPPLPTPVAKGHSSWPLCTHVCAFGGVHCAA